MNSSEIMYNMQSVSTIDFDETCIEDDIEMNEEMEPKLRLAITLKNWSIIPDNDSNLLSEGAVHALVALSSNDSSAIKKHVASAFYHLSSRENNRLALIKANAVNGIVSISMHPARFVTAKLCALALCNLSMCNNEEATVAENGAILALTILLGLRGHRLLPVCVQALYNLTCCSFTSHFKPETMRRIVKSLVNVPQTHYDHHIHLIKSIFNICRFSWVRSRMIEDGVLHSLLSFSESIPNRGTTNDKQEYASLIIASIRMLAEIASGRNDMIHKGSIQHLYNILPYCSSESILELTLVIYNLIQMKMPSQYFEAAAWTIAQILTDWNDKSIDIQQYCSICIYLFIQKQHVLTFICIQKLMVSVTKLFGSTVPLIQASVMAICDLIMFNEHM